MSQIVKLHQTWCKNTLMHHIQCNLAFRTPSSSRLSLADFMAANDSFSLNTLVKSLKKAFVVIMFSKFNAKRNIISTFMLPQFSGSANLTTQIFGVITLLAFPCGIAIALPIAVDSTFSRSTTSLRKSFETQPSSISFWQATFRTSFLLIFFSILNY